MGGGSTLFKLFADQVDRQPDAMAIVCQDHQLSYAELARRSRNIASMVSAHGVRSEELVGILMQRSIDLLPTILGVLHAGCAYLPLDPEYPTDRLKYIIADADCKLLLTDDGRQSASAAPQQCQVVNIHDRREFFDHQPSNTVAAYIADSNLAYVIYTSGSTGQPKGVMIEHQAATSLIRWALDVFDESELSVVLASTSICFDLSIFELFVPIACGGKIVMANSILDLPDVPHASEVTLLNSVPSAMGEIARRKAVPPSVQTINIAGEPLKRSLVNRLYTCSNVQRIYNLYGPSEDTTYSTFSLVPRECPAEPTIGKPITGTTAAVVGPDLLPVPPGQEGELLLMGRGLARGYHKRPRLTAEKFVVDNSGRSLGQRAYRTGDRVRLLPDGDLEFMGRFDHQVKVRGYRIELMEIESYLSFCPLVDDCAVIVDQSSSGYDRLHAFIQAATEPSVASLREQLSRHLPKYMIPNLYTFVQELPKTPSGKIDRHQLLRLGNAVKDGGQTEHDPGCTESRLARIWTDLLDIPTPGWDDHFLDIGGDSLTAVRIAARINQELGLNLSTKDLLDSPTIRELAEQFRASEQPNVVQPILRLDSSYSPTSFAQRRLWFQQQLESDAACYNVAAGLHLRGPLDRAALQTTLDRIVELHESLRTSFAVEDNEVYQQIHPAYRVQLSESKLANKSAGHPMGAVLKQVREGLSRPCDLTSGKPAHFQLIEFGSQEYLLAITLPHIVFDDWSQTVLTEDFERIYRSLTVADNVTEPKPSDIRYLDFAAWQKNRHEQGELEGELQFWRRQLAAAPPVLELPGDFPRPARPSSRGFRLSLPIDRSLLEELRSFGRAQTATLFTTLLTAFKALLSAKTGQSDIVVGSAVAGRNHFQTERIVGCFINAVAMRTQLNLDETVLETLQRVRGVVSDALSHQELPFENLVEALNPPRVLGNTPIFQVAFGVQNAPKPVLVNAPLQIESLEITADYARFDLTVWIEERNDADTVVHWTCRADLFREETVRGWHESFCDLLRAAIGSPSQSLRSWIAQSDSNANQPAQRETLGKSISSRRRNSMTESRDSKRTFSRRTPKRIRPTESVKSRRLQADSPLPLLYECSDGRPISTWGEQDAGLINAALLDHGGVLLRGFDCSEMQEFREFASIISDDLVDYSERSSPRTELAQGVYTSTDHPPDQPIAMHNEQSYNLRWPLKIMFYCQQPAESGGQTPIADSRRILQALDAETVESFRQRGILYVRNYNCGLGLTWQTAFQTDDRGEVERYCRQQEIEYRWDGDRLHTKQVRAALRKHPKTGETIWFNHALFFNVYSLGLALRSSLLESVGEEGLSTNTYFGDGEPIPDRTLEDLATAYRQHRVVFDWQQGDVLVLDNMLTAHGREPFQGPRKVLAAMADLTDGGVASQLSGQLVT